MPIPVKYKFVDINAGGCITPTDSDDMLSHLNPDSGYMQNVMSYIIQNQKSEVRVAWVPDSCPKLYNKYSSELMYDTIGSMPPLEYIQFDYIFNRTKKQFINVHNIQSTNIMIGSKIVKSINPIPLLTCVGHGFELSPVQSYFDTSLFGFWAGDALSVSRATIIPSNFRELKFKFNLYDI
jgi:hypothetical protein